MVSGHFDEIEVALEIVVTGNQVRRLAVDSSFEDFIVIGIAAGFQSLGNCNQRCPRGYQSDKPRGLPLRIFESSQESRPVKNLREFGELRERRYGAEFIPAPCADNLSGRTGRFEKSRDPDVGVKQSDERHGV